MATASVSRPSVTEMPPESLLLIAIGGVLSLLVLIDFFRRVLNRDARGFADLDGRFANGFAGFSKFLPGVRLCDGVCFGFARTRGEAQRCGGCECEKDAHFWSFQASLPDRGRDKLRTRNCAV